MFALAEKKHVFIYDTASGAEVHRLDDHIDPMALQFLPHHWLLSSVGRAGWLKYTDTSTGNKVSEHRTKVSDREGGRRGCRCVLCLTLCSSLRSSSSSRSSGLAPP